MAYSLVYFYDTSVHLDNVPTKIVEDMDTGEVSEAIIKCAELKNSNNPMPVGFSIVEYDEYDFTVKKSKNYYLNGKVIDSKNLLADWGKNLIKDVRKMVYINENFCVPFHEETDTILTVVNL